MSFVKDYRARVWLLLLLLAACQPAPSMTPLPTAHVWRVQLTPTLDWMGAAMNHCTSRRVGLDLLTDSRSAAFIDPQKADISLMWGTPETLTGQAFILGWDELVVIVHPSNPLQTLNDVVLKGVYTGNPRSWQAVDASIPLRGDIRVFTYPDGEDTRRVFDELLNNPRPSPMAYLAPDAESMRQEVANDALAIGYVPRRWVNGQVRAIQLNGIAPERLRQPILALSAGEMKEDYKEWLLCLQAIFQI